MYLKGTRLYFGLFLICVCTIGSRYIAVEYNTILNKNTKGRKPKLCSDYELTKDTPYLTLTGELWGAFSGFFREELPRDIENILYCGESQITVTDTQGVQQSGKRQGNTRLDRSQQNLRNFLYTSMRKETKIWYNQETVREYLIA